MTKSKNMACFRMPGSLNRLVAPPITDMKIIFLIRNIINMYSQKGQKNINTKNEAHINTRENGSSVRKKIWLFL